MPIFQDGADVVDGVTEIPLPGQPLGCMPPAGRSPDAAAALSHFVAGPENRLAEVAVASLLNGRGRRYDLLLLHGLPGTGKSHLAHGLAAQFKASTRRHRVVYTTADDFFRELNDAIETQATEDFRHCYRRASLLVFEDVHRLAGKRVAEEELVHTLDAVQAAGGRVVLTSTAAGGEIPRLALRLQSRLAAALAVPLAPPGSAARAVILRHLAELNRLQLSDSALRLLANGLSGTVRELAGAVLQLQFTARLNAGAVDSNAVKAYLANQSGARQAELPEIAVATARFFSLNAAELRSPSRRRNVVTARGVAMYLARRLTSHSLQHIGRYFGRRDHTTVMHACRKTERSLKTDPAICRAVEQLQKKWRAAPQRT